MIAFQHYNYIVSDSDPRVISSCPDSTNELNLLMYGNNSIQCSTFTRAHWIQFTLHSLTTWYANNILCTIWLWSLSPWLRGIASELESEQPNKSRVRSPVWGQNRQIYHIPGSECLCLYNLGFFGVLRVEYFRQNGVIKTGSKWKWFPFTTASDSPLVTQWDGRSPPLRAKHEFSSGTSSMVFDEEWQFNKPHLVRSNCCSYKYFNWFVRTMVVYPNETNRVWNRLSKR